MTVSWGNMGVMWNKNIVTAFIRPQRYTHEFLEAGDFFTLSFYGEDMLSLIHIFLEPDAPLTRRLEAIRKSDVLIDAIFGTGFSGELPAACKELAEAVNNCRAIKVALDVPSGIDCDTGFSDRDTLRACLLYTSL